RAIRRKKEYRLLERVAAVLRTRQGCECAMGIRERKVLYHFGSEVSGWRVVPVSAQRRAGGANPQSRSFRRSQLANVFDWRTAEPGAHVVFADHTDDRRGGARGAD